MDDKIFHESAEIISCFPHGYVTNHATVTQIFFLNFQIIGTLNHLLFVINFLIGGFLSAGQIFSGCS